MTDEAQSGEVVSLRPEVAAFAQLMERQLRANDHKPGWKGDHPLDLLMRAEQETQELRVEISSGRAMPMDQAAVGREAADVGNMVMMVADVCGALRTPPQPSAGAEVERLRSLLFVGEKFLNACFSAWSCGEPSHRVKTMLDRADEFRAALAANPPAAEGERPPIIEALVAVVGEDGLADQAEARARFIEEAIELVQAAGGTEAEVAWMASRVFAEPTDPVALEVGQVMTALARLAFAHGVDPATEAAKDLAHIRAKAAWITERHARKARLVL